MTQGKYISYRDLNAESRCRLDELVREFYQGGLDADGQWPPGRLDTIRAKLEPSLWPALREALNLARPPAGRSR